MLHTNFTCLCFIEPKLLLLEIAGKGIFYRFWSCDLDLDPMTFICKFDPYPVEIYRM